VRAYTVGSEEVFFFDCSFLRCFIVGGHGTGVTDSDENINALLNHSIDVRR